LSGLDATVRRDARLVWDHLSAGNEPTGPVDVIIALGCRDERVAEWAADLLLAGGAPLMVVTGGTGKDTPSGWVSEAERFEAVALRAGVPAGKILREDRATNTGENLDLSRRLLLSAGVETRSALLVTKPYMRRRAAATAAHRWPGVRVFTSAPGVSFEEHVERSEVERDMFLSLLTGDLQRMKLYAERGFQAADPVPVEVWAAFERLAAAGYDMFVLPPTDV